MHKNYRPLITLFFLPLAISSCSLLPRVATKRNDKSTSTNINLSQEVLKDERFDSICLCGENTIRYQNRNYQNNWDKNSNNAMKAISLYDLAKIDAELAYSVANKNVKGLYKFEGLVFGVRKNVEWTTTALVNNRVREYNGSYAFKSCAFNSDKDGYLVNSGWFPSMEFPGESLTKDTLFITDNMSGEVDRNGFNYDSNPVALNDGTFVAILATYQNRVGQYGISCGLGLIKTGD